MLEALFSSQVKEQVLVFLLVRGEGYPRQLARFFDVDVYGVQRQLDKLEQAGIVVSKRVGRTLLYRFNPRYALLNELKALLKRTLDFYPADLRQRLELDRRRPRIRDKPL